MSQFTDTILSIKTEISRCDILVSMRDQIAEYRAVAVNEALEAGDLRDRLLDEHSFSSEREAIEAVLQFVVNKATREPDKIDVLTSGIDIAIQSIRDQCGILNRVVEMAGILESQIETLRETVATLKGMNSNG